MRNLFGRTGVVVLVALLAVGVGAAYGAPKGELKVGVGALSGVVADSTGKTLSDVPLRLMRELEVVAQTRTAKDGKYELKNLTPGRYEIYVGSERALRIAASPDSTVNTLQIVVPRPYSAAAEEKSGQWVWVGAGVGGSAIVAISTALIVSNNIDVDEHVVSP